MRRQPRSGGKRHVLRWVAVAAVVIVAAGTLGVYLKYRAVFDSITRVTVPGTALGHRPPVYNTNSQNILVYGDDTRTGLTAHQQYVLHAGHDQTNNTDTIMLVHISPGHHHLTVLSIPRDTMVPVYECDSGPGYTGQQANPAGVVQINSLLQIGGPTCLWKTVEQVTGIHLDHFIEVGLGGFVNVINDLGGVNVCAPFDINNTVSGLVLPAGEHHIDGVTALAFWRTRENIGEGSDLQRISRDQFMSAQVVKGILATGLLGDPIKLFRVLSDLAPNLTIDSGMSVTDLLHLGQSLHGLDSKDVQFVTAPVGAWPYDPNAVGLAQPTADAMFAAIAHDVTLPKGTKGGASVSAGPSGTSGAATPSASAAQGGPGGAPALAAGSRKLATDATPSATAGTAATPTAGATAGAGASPSPSDSASGIRSLAANHGGINAAAACRSDAAAFAGPNSPSYP